MKPNIIMGTISCITPTTFNCEYRKKMHKKQLSYLEWMFKDMSERSKEAAFPYIRIEQGWDSATQSALQPSFPHESVSLEKPIPPGAARNILLKRLYQSDADWLICTDDDHCLYDNYLSHEMLWELSEPGFLALAKQGCLITAFPSYWDPYLHKIEKWGKSDKFWWVKTTNRPTVPFACIPNLKKFGREPLYFYEGDVVRVPEDMKFMIDWVAAGNKWTQCMQFIGKTCGNLSKSSILETSDERKERDDYANYTWATQYLKQKFPRQPELWVKKFYMKRKNPAWNIAIPRKHTHSFDSRGKPITNE